jgi:hypothetical protein
MAHKRHILPRLNGRIINGRNHELRSTTNQNGLDANLFEVRFQVNAHVYTERDQLLPARFNLFHHLFQSFPGRTAHKTINTGNQNEEQHVHCSGRPTGKRLARQAIYSPDICAAKTSFGILYQRPSRSRSSLSYLHLTGSTYSAAVSMMQPPSRLPTIRTAASLRLLGRPLPVVRPGRPQLGDEYRQMYLRFLPHAKTNHVVQSIREPIRA